MIWENASYLWLLLLLPVLFAAETYAKNYFSKKRASFFSQSLFLRLAGKPSEGIRTLRRGLLYGALFLFITGLAGPKIGMEIREVQRDGVDLIIALDVSRSMLAEDVRPNRLDKAKFEIYRLLERLGGDRVGLIVFTSMAYLQVPLTNDYGAFRMFLDISDPEIVSTQGTNFSRVLATSYDAFEDVRNQGSNAAQVLLMFSDGEDHGPDISNQLARLSEAGVFIYTVGIGNREGATIPVRDARSGQQVDVHRDRQGSVVTSRLEPEILQHMARTTGGEYYEITRASQGLDGFINKLTQLERSAFATEELVDYRNQYQVIVALGFFLLLAYAMLPITYKKSENSI